MQDGIETLTIQGTEYRDLDHLNYNFIFVAEGFAFGQKDIGEGYYMSVNPQTLLSEDLGEGETVERTFYQAKNTTLYVADNLTTGAPRDTDYIIDGKLWQYDGKARGYQWDEKPDSVEPCLPQRDYVRFTTSDDELLLTYSDWQRALEREDIKELWPVWSTAHR